MWSPIWILIIAFTLVTLRSSAQFFMVDQRKIKLYRKKIQEWQEKKEEARKKQDPRLLKKVQSKKSKIRRFQTAMTKERMKPMCLFMIPFLIVFWTIRWLFPSPIPLHFSFPMNWITQRFFTKGGTFIKTAWYYVLCNIASNTLITVTFQLLGFLEKTGGPGMGLGMSQR